MTKADIVDAVAAKFGFSPKEAHDIVETLINTMREELRAGESIKLSAFGNFTVRSKRTRKGRNPQTGAPLTIESRKVLTFKASNILRDALN